MKLGNEYRNFMDVIEGIEEVMRQLSKKLDIDIEEKVKYDPKLAKALLTFAVAKLGLGIIYVLAARFQKREMGIEKDTTKLWTQRTKGSRTKFRKV